MPANKKNAYKEKVSKEKFIFSTADTCEFFGISRESLSTWRKKGAPKFARGKWDVQAVMKWRFLGDNIESPQTRKIKAEADLKELKAVQEKIKLNVTKGEFISVKQAKEDLKRTFANLKKSLLAISHNCASVLASQDFEAVPIVEEVVDKCVTDALTELSEGRSYRAKTTRKKKK